MEETKGSFIDINDADVIYQHNKKDLSIHLRNQSPISQIGQDGN